MLQRYKKMFNYQRLMSNVPHNHPHIPNPKHSLALAHTYPIQNSEFKIQNSKFKILLSEG